MFQIPLLFVSALLILSANPGAGRAEEWPPATTGPLTTWTAGLCEKDGLTIQPYVFYFRDRGAFDGNGQHAALPDGDSRDHFQESLFFQYGVSGRLELAGQFTFQQSFISQSGMEIIVHGFTDSFLFLRYGLSPESVKAPELTAIVQVKVPTGKYEKGDPEKNGYDLLGTGSWDPGFGLCASKHLRPFILHADASISFPLETVADGATVRYGSYVNYDLGVEYVMRRGFNLLLEANGILQNDTVQEGATVADSRSSSLLLAPGIGWSNDTVQTLLGCQRVVSGTNTDAYDAVVCTLVYSF